MFVLFAGSFPASLEQSMHRRRHPRKTVILRSSLSVSSAHFKACNLIEFDISSSKIRSIRTLWTICAHNHTSRTLSTSLALCLGCTTSCSCALYSLASSLFYLSYPLSHLKLAFVSSFCCFALSFLFFGCFVCKRKSVWTKPKSMFELCVFPCRQSSVGTKTINISCVLSCAHPKDVSAENITLLWRSLKQTSFSGLFAHLFSRVPLSSTLLIINIDVFAHRSVDMFHLK